MNGWVVLGYNPKTNEEVVLLQFWNDSINTSAHRT